MHQQVLVDSAPLLVNELSSRVVAESGIATDRYHLGKLVLKGLKETPDFIAQIDGATGESESCGSVLARSVRCASAMRAWGMRRGDIIALIAPNHLDLAIPFYAALYLGITIAPLDYTYKDELQEAFNTIKPKVVFCQSEKVPEVQKYLKEAGLECQIITFDKTENICSFNELMVEAGDDHVEDFRPEDFDPEDTISFLLQTSGTIGVPKTAAFTHKIFYSTSRNGIDGDQLSKMNESSEFAKSLSLSYLVLNSMHWISTVMSFLWSSIGRLTRVQSSLTITPELTIKFINTYKPITMYITPIMMTVLLNREKFDPCDFSCIKVLPMGGTVLPCELVEKIESIAPNTKVYQIYGLTELTGTTFKPNRILGSCGNKYECFKYQLVNIDTREEITKPHTPGELWVKGPGVFTEYHNNPEATKAIFSEDGWFMTGDIMYRDEDWNFFFVDRIKMSYMTENSHHINPAEIDSVIRKHPDVAEVAVMGIPHMHINVTTAFVVRRTGTNVTAQDIENLVKESLSEHKKITGGVFFMDELPKTITGKINYKLLKASILKKTVNKSVSNKKN